MTWRITGHVLHAVLSVDESLDNNGLPVPKEPQGQVKMLVQTNMELSRKLNLMRRDYLRELTSHRDKQRSISDEAQEVLQDLQEHPVMFFEPLKFVLDDVTKEFIKLVVEERARLLSGCLRSSHFQVHAASHRMRLAWPAVRFTACSQTSSLQVLSVFLMSMVPVMRGIRKKVTFIRKYII
ncbi:unnamed protein product [Symbiodinium pilosum]|uniref:Uncharacterized protein n=1 Tax=Symbiodinium pilosum TaxID=2952 RepID=A0A812X6G0_SYMPI|nr:unnamed protein product [Symbiodinium pilosum]